MEFLLFLGACVVLVAVLRVLRSTEKLSRIAPSVPQHIQGMHYRPPDEAFGMMCISSESLERMEAATIYLKDARRKLSERHAKLVLRDGLSVDERKVEFNAAWRRVVATSAATFGGPATGKAMLRLGY